MSVPRARVVVVGVGGQGSVFLARVLGEAALRAGLGAVASELHGMAQRGGVVESTVIIGPGRGPIIAPGEADLLIALEPLEALRALRLTKQGGAAVVGTTPIVPYTVSLGGPPYPPIAAVVERLIGWLDIVAALDLVGIATAVGDPRTMGAAALGVVAGLDVLPVSRETLRESTRLLAPASKREQNVAAFDAGHEAAPAAIVSTGRRGADASAHRGTTS